MAAAGAKAWGETVRMLRPHEMAYRAIKRRIVLNELRPEEPLTELGLAHWLNCSQGPVREALLRLQQDGLVTRTPNRATTVTPLAPDEAAEILVLRRRIETRGAERGAAHVTQGDLAALSAQVDAMRRIAGQGDEYGLIELDTDFHLAVFRLSGLQALEPILTRCILHSHRSKLWAPGNHRTLLETAGRHEDILTALATRDGRHLAAVLDHHIDTIVDTRQTP
jgi:DNA-binding GntR family transcriptional regulator